MNPSVSLPSSLLKKLLFSEMRRAPTQSLYSASPQKLERWLDALENWRTAWVAMETQPESAKTLIEDPGLWTVAINAIKPWAHSSASGRGWERAGDWNDEGDTNYIDRVASEREQWIHAGWSSVAKANSSSEWAALMVLEMEERLGVVLSEKDWENRVRQAFERDSAAVMTRLLEQSPERSPVDVLTRVSAPKSQYAEADPPLAHLLFDGQHYQASLALARQRPGDMVTLVNAPDAKGQTPLFYRAHDVGRTQQLLKHGADPMARNHRNCLADEAAFQNTGPASEAESFHNALNAFRTLSDQQKARPQWLAAMSTSCSWNLLKSLGLSAEVQSLTHVEVEGKPGTLLGYMLAFCDNRRSNKELLQLLSHLSKGAKGRQLLQAGGSVEEGLAQLFALGLNNRADHLSDRAIAITESVGGILKTLQAEPHRLDELVHRTFELSKPVYTDSLHAFMGPAGLLSKAVDLSKVNWDPERLENVRLGILRSGAHLLNVASDAQDKARWKNAGQWVLAWTEGMEHNDELKARWLPVVLATASSLKVPEVSQALEERAVAWLVADVQPVWETPEQEKKVMARVENTLAHAMAQVRQHRMDQQFEPAARRSGPRL